MESEVLLTSPYKYKATALCDTFYRLKTHLFNIALFTASLPVPPASLKLRHYQSTTTALYKCIIIVIIITPRALRS